MASILRALEGVVQRPKDELAKEVARAQAEVQQLSEAAKARFSELEHKEKPSTTPPRLFPDANGAAPPAREPSLPRADSAQQSAVAASLQSDVAKLQKQLGTAESEAEASKRAAIERARQADEATAALKHATEQVAAKEKKLAAAEAEAKRLEKLKTDAEAKASNLQADLEHLRSSAAEDAQPTTGPEAQRLENLRHQAEARSTALQNDVRALREKLASSERSAAASTAKAEAAAAEADRLSYQSKQSEARSAALEAEVRELRGKLASAAASNLKAEAAMAEEATTQNDVRELREKLASSERSAAASTAKAEAAAAEADRLSNQSKQSEVRSAALEAEVRELRGKLASLAASTAKAEAAAEETEETLLENLRDQAKARPSTLKSEIHEQLRAKASAADGTAAATLLLSQPPPAAGGDLADATGVKQEANGLCPAAACPPRCGSPEARSPPGLRRELEATVDRLSVKLSATAAALAESNARRAEAEDAVASLRAAERSPPQRSPAQPASPDLVGGAQVRVSALEARVGALQHTVDRLTNEKEQLSLAVVTVSDTAMSRVAVAEKKAGELQSKLEKVNAELVTRKAHEAAVRSYSTAREDRGSLTREAPSLSRGGEFRALYESEKHKSRALSRRLESISREIDRTRTECAVSPELVPLSQFDSNLPHDLPLSQPQSSQYPTSGYPGSFAPPGYCYASELPNHLPSPSPGTPSSLVPVVLTYNTMLTPQSGGAHPMWFPGRLSAPQVPNPSQHEVEDSTGDVEHGENVTLSQNLYLSQNLNQSQNPNQSQNQQEMHQVKLEHNAPPTPPSSRADTADNSQPKTAGKRPPAPVSSSQRAKRQRTMSQVEVSDTDSERQEIRRPRLSQQEAKKLTDRQIHSRIRALRPDTWTGTEDRKLADLCKKELPKCVGAEKTARLNKLFDKAAKVLEKDRDVVENHFWANKESLSQEMNTPVPKRPTRSYTDEQQEVWDDLSELVQAADDKHKARELASHVMAEITGKSAASIRPAMR
ncbi:hypothetical protein DIPPA_05488 [Diplonema papillatum]|nr:hypothetical protein DIPPA_05488 [Diplonema papillatum]